MAEKPSIDVTQQVALGAGVPPERDVTKEVFDLVSEAADVLQERSERRGVLVVVGHFASIGEVKGARLLGKNPFEGQYVSAGDKVFQRMLLQDNSLGDGAVIVDASGQILGGRVYLVVDHPEVEIPPGSATRHLAAASASLRKDVESVITLSEETNIVRLFRGGRVVETHDPASATRSKKSRKTTMLKTAEVLQKLAERAEEGSRGSSSGDAGQSKKQGA